MKCVSTYNSLKRILLYYSLSKKVVCGLRAADIDYNLIVISVRPRPPKKKLKIALEPTIEIIIIDTIIQHYYCY